MKYFRMLSLAVLFGGVSYFLYKKYFPQEHKLLRGPAPHMEWFANQRAIGNGEIDHDARFKAIEQAKVVLAETKAAALMAGHTLPKWQTKGPTNVGGRVTDIAGDYKDPNKYYVGAASGGVWKTTDGGKTFKPVFDGLATLAVGAIATDPTDSDIVYVGTGEANPGGGSVGYAGNGIYKTTDGGKTWQHLGLDKTRYIGRIMIDPADTDRVYIAAMGNLFSKNKERGVYRSEDGGKSWKQVLYVDDQTGAIDLAVDPNNSKRVFAATWQRIRLPNTRDYGGPGSAIYRTEDNGDKWTKLTKGLPTKPMGRIGIALSAANPKTVYAVYADRTGYFGGVYKSNDYGSTWTDNKTTGLSSSFYNSYGWWFGRVVVHPKDASSVWALGFRAFRSSDGARSFTQFGRNMHVDHHALWINPTKPSIMIAGNDGGIYKSTNAGSTWNFIELPITQLYTISRHPKVDEVYAGMQDNGTHRSTKGRIDQWQYLNGGDGFTALVDPNNPKIIYVESQYGNLKKSTDGGRSFFSATRGITGRRNWHTPYVIDPHTQDVLYLGTEKLYRSTNAAGSWRAISGDLSDGAKGSNGVVFGTITTIAVAPSTKDVIYAGTDDGNVWVTKDYGKKFIKITKGLPKRWVTRVSVDYKDPATAYVTLSGLRSDKALAYVFKTSDYGANWKNISGNLPLAPVNDIVISKTNANHLIVATDVGVFTSKNGGTTWSTFGDGMPTGLVITDLELVGEKQQKVYAASYGRSSFVASF